MTTTDAASAPQAPAASTAAGFAKESGLPLGAVRWACRKLDLPRTGDGRRYAIGKAEGAKIRKLLAS